MLRPRVLALLAIVVAAFVLRFRGLDYQLPHWTFLDGYPLFDQARWIRGEEPWSEAGQQLGYYPYLTSATAAALPDVRVLEPVPSDALETLRQEACEPWIRIRLAAVLISILAVGATYGIARSFLGVGASLLASAFVATSLMHVTFSAAQRPHGPASATAALAVLAALYLRREGTWRAHLACAGAVALAVATLQTCLPALFSWALAWTFAKPAEPRSAKTSVTAWIAGLAIVAVAVRLAYPFHFDAVPSASYGEGVRDGDVELASHTIHLDRFNGRGFLVLASSFANYDPVLTLALLGGLALLAVRSIRRTLRPVPERARDAWVCLAFAAPLFAFCSLYELTWARFLLPLVPFAAVIAAWALSEAWRWIARERWPRPASLAAAAAVLAFPTFIAWRIGTLRATDDTFEVAAEWISEHAEPDRSRIVVLQASFDLPLLYSEDSLAFPNPNPSLYWTQVLMRHGAADFEGPRFRVEHLPGEFELGAEPLAALREAGYDFAVTLSTGFRRELRSVGAALREARRSGRTVVFDPFSDEPSKAERMPEMGFGVLEAATTWSLLASERLGPRLEVVRL